MIVYLVFLGLLACLRIWELRRSKANWRIHRDKADMLAERLFPWMVALHGSFFVLLPLELFWRRPQFGGPLSYAALSIILIAFILRFWTLHTMGRSWNVRVVGGQDYPIVSNGPYRYIRHPNYLVVVLELLFIPLIFKLYFSAAILTLGNLVVLSIRIRNEERILRQNPEWVRTMGGKPRFLPWGP
ncbi:MAG: isoprenylcysteine carboxylmethyltransferase family protein [Acidobacteriota bacterium]|nr:isoprenylcysteine carboxylmethyltransferase family protein [Acidobacteriota bacterium]